jgi:hypothetical protein
MSGMVLHLDPREARGGTQGMSATYVDLVVQEVGTGAVRPAATRTLADALSQLRFALPLALSALTIVPNVSTTVRQPEHDYFAIYEADSTTFNDQAAPVHHISELGWTTEQASAMRHKLSAFADDWNVPAMDAYDAL